MSITFGTTTDSDRPKQNLSLDNATIVTADIVYNEKQKWQKTPDDVGVVLTLDIGKSFQPSFYVGGWFKKDIVSNNVVGWGSAYKVKILLDAVGMTGARIDTTKTVEHQRFPQETAEQLLGKTFTRLSYKSTREKPDGGNYWTDWQQVAQINHFEELKKAFFDAVNHRDPATDEPQTFVKDYLHP